MSVFVGKWEVLKLWIAVSKDFVEYKGWLWEKMKFECKKR
jgi:hypothetical protein